MMSDSPVEIAGRIDKCLKEQGATRVLFFGSLVDGDFDPKYSDIDVYFEGVPREKCNAVWMETLSRFSSQSLDIWWPDGGCRPELLKHIQKTGVPLEEIGKSVPDISEKPQRVALDILKRTRDGIEQIAESLDLLGKEDMSVLTYSVEALSFKLLSTYTCLEALVCSLLKAKNIRFKKEYETRDQEIFEAAVANRLLREDGVFRELLIYRHENWTHSLVERGDEEVIAMAKALLEAWPQAEERLAECIGQLAREGK